MAETVSFTLEYHRHLTPQGELIRPVAEDWLAAEKVKSLYRWMVLSRAYDNKAIALQRTGKMGTYASILGQEAISTAIGETMAPEDVLVPYYRDYTAMMMRGVSMTEIYRYWGGDERGSCYANNAEDLPISVPIASQTLHAVGVAYAFKYRQQPRVVVTTVGDGGTSEGDFYEALNVAGAWQLPVVFVINNNQWAISVPRDQQSACGTLAQKAIAGGLPGVQVDGNDIFALTTQLSTAIARARQGQGASVIEALTYRLCDHTTADDMKRYCPAADVERAWEEEPIVRLRRYLTAQKLWTEADEDALISECEEQVRNTVDAYLSSDLPKLEDCFDYHFANIPEDLNRQKHHALTGE